MSLRIWSLLLAAFAALAGASGVHHGRNTSAQDAITVSMINNTYAPATLTVSAGTTVTWVNNEDPNGADVTHDIITDDYTTINSGFVDPGQSVSFTFTDPGTYHYVCDLHALMEGTITVQ
ncbi:MAG: cupredoxin domain-containing protein [Dehalococcoidia bacterium]